MTQYHASIVVANDGTVIALRHIESINITRDGEEKLIDKLKGDYLIEINTNGGKNYIISTTTQLKHLGNQYQMPKDLKELQEAIVSRWYRMMSGISD